MLTVCVGLASTAVFIIACAFAAPFVYRLVWKILTAGEKACDRLFGPCPD